MTAIAAAWYRQVRAGAAGVAKEKEDDDDEEELPVAVLRMNPERGVHGLPVLEEFRRTGCFQLELSPELLTLNATAFRAARRFMALPEEVKARHRSVAGGGGSSDGSTAAPTAPGSLNGFHSKGGLSRYNQHRSGFIFEDETVLNLMEGTGVIDDVDFVGSITAWRVAVHALAADILGRLAEQLLGSDRRDYFETALGFRGSGQMHFKRTHFSLGGEGGGGGGAGEDEEKHVLLLPHTDPSLISLVIHDRPPPPSSSSSENRRHCTPGGAMGLEVYRGKSKRYEPLGRCGWGVATVFLGDVLVKMFGIDSSSSSSSSSSKNPLGLRCGLVAPKHRVAYTERQMREEEEDEQGGYRHAATVFIQPRLDAPMRNPLGCSGSGNGQQQGRQELTYGAWRGKVYGRYYARKGKQQQRK